MQNNTKSPTMTHHHRVDGLYQPKNHAAFEKLVAAGLKYQNGRWAGPLFRLTAEQVEKYASLLIV